VVFAPVASQPPRTAPPVLARPCLGGWRPPHRPPLRDGPRRR
jgi:hypothetical protein